MPKLIIAFLLCIATFSIKAQTITCKDSTYDNGYYKSVLVCDTIPYTSTCYDTSLVDYDSCYTVKRRHRNGTKTKCEVKQKIIITPYACNKIKIDCNNVTIWVRKDTTILICDTILSTVITHFGAKIQNDKVANQINVAGQLGLYAVRPGSVAMDTYSGVPNSLKSFSDAGYFCIINISYTNTSGGNIVPYLPYADTAQYKIKLEQFCKDNKQYIGILVIENEPINRQYFSGNFANYIAQLRMSVEIAHKYGIKVVSGCIHLQLAEAVRSNATGDDRVTDTRTLLNAEKTIPVDYTNVHDSYEKATGGFKVPDFVSIVNWVSTYTGHEVISNEISMVGANPPIATQYVSLGRQAKMPYFVFWSGDVFNGVMPAGGTSKGDALNQGLILSDIGKAVRDAIK